MPDSPRATYAAMAAEAEAAVASVKDPELRRVAFEKILTALLEGQPDSKRRLPVARRAAAAPKISKGLARPVEETARRPYGLSPGTHRRRLFQEAKDHR